MTRDERPVGTTSAGEIARNTSESGVTREGMTRRTFVKRSAGVGLAGLLSGSTAMAAGAKSPEMKMFLAVWQNVGGVRIPWTSKRPRDLAETRLRQ